MTGETQTTAKRQAERFSPVRAIAKTMIAVGLVLIGFVVYELWVTSYFARRAQGGLQEQFQERAATVELEVLAYEDPGDRPEAPFEVPAGIPDPAEVAVAGAGSEIAGSGDTDGPVIVVEPPPPPGDAIGRIIIPEAGVDWSIVEGVEWSDLRRAVGHIA